MTNDITKLAQNNNLDEVRPPMVLDNLTRFDFSTENGFWMLLAEIFNAFLIFAGIFALIAIIYGGLQYVTSAGDESKAQTAKKTITMAITGIVIIFLALVIIRFVKESIGV